MVEQHEHVEPQKPAVTPEVSLLDEYPEEETVNDPVSNEKVDEQSLEKTEATAVKKRVTKRNRKIEGSSHVNGLKLPRYKEMVNI